MAPPTEAQQKGVAYAHIPIAIISFVASSYVIFTLLSKERHKLNRVYHRLVLVMNFALLALLIVLAWRPFSVPKGTPDFAAASGSIQTCTASGFLYMVLSTAVALYYSSLSLQAFLSMKHNFKEEKYRWTEKYIHLFVWCFPCAIASVAAAAENINPTFRGCNATAYPLGCDADPDVQCQRGGDRRHFNIIMGLTLTFMCLIFTPSVLVAICCQINKLDKSASGTIGMQKIRDSTRKQMMKNVAMQISFYYFSFLFIYIFTIGSAISFLLTRTITYDLAIFANCCCATQGIVFAATYFTLQRLGRKEIVIERVSHPASPRVGQHAGHTVEEIRENVENSVRNGIDNNTAAHNTRRMSFSFSIFDGTPDETSPWAMFIDPIDDEDECSTNEDEPVYNGSGVRNENIASMEATP